MQCIAELLLPGDGGLNQSHDSGRRRCRRPKILRIYAVAHILHVNRRKLSTDEPLWSLVVRVFIAVEKRSCSTDSIISVQLGRDAHSLVIDC